MILLTAGGEVKDLQIDRVEVTLAERAGPIVELRLATGQDIQSSALRSWLKVAPTGLDVGLTIGGGPPLPLYLIGFRAESFTTSTAAPAVVAVTVALPPAARDWFDLRPPDADRYVWLVAQRLAGGDPWDFLAGTVGGRVAPPPGNVPWDTLFGPGACVLRVGAWTNRCFLEHLVTLLTERTASVWGWAAVNDPAEPLRLITDVNPLQLDAGWETVNALPGKPTLLAGTEWARRSVRVRTAFDCRSGAKMIPRLVSCGTQADAGLFAESIAGRLDQLMLLPGAVRVGDATLCAHTVRYAWSEGGQVELTLDLRHPVKPVARPATGGLLLEAAFTGWGPGGAPKPGETAARVSPASHADPDAAPTWAVLNGESGVDPAGAITVRVMTPFAGRPEDQTAGLYVTRHSGDPLVVVVTSGHAPVALGQPHRYDEAREKDGVTLNDLRLALSTSPTSTPDADADAVHMADGVIRAAAAGKVELMKGVTIEPTAVTCEKAVTANNTLTVGGNVELKKDLSVSGNAKVGGELEAGSG